MDFSNLLGHAKYQGLQEQPFFDDITQHCHSRTHRHHLFSKYTGYPEPKKSTTSRSETTKKTSDARHSAVQRLSPHKHNTIGLCASIYFSTSAVDITAPSYTSFASTPIKILSAPGVLKIIHNSSCACPHGKRISSTALPYRGLVFDASSQQHSPADRVHGKAGV